MCKMFLLMINEKPISILQKIEDVIEFCKMNKVKDLEVFEIRDKEKSITILAQIEQGLLKKNTVYDLGHLVYGKNKWKSKKQK